MCGYLLRLFSRLDFWATLLDIAGLAILVSHDVRSLKFVDSFIKNRRAIKRLTNIEERVLLGLHRFQLAYPAIGQAIPLDTFDGKDATILSAMFKKANGKEIPKEFDLCACFVGATMYFTTTFVWIARKGETDPLTIPITESAFEKQFESKRMNYTYTVGFVLMAVSSLILLIDIGLRNYWRN